MIVAHTLSTYVGQEKGCVLWFQRVKDRFVLPERQVCLADISVRVL